MSTNDMNADDVLEQLRERNRMILTVASMRLGEVTAAFGWTPHVENIDGERLPDTDAERGFLVYADADGNPRHVLGADIWTPEKLAQRYGVPVTVFDILDGTSETVVYRHVVAGADYVEQFTAAHNDDTKES